MADVRPLGGLLVLDLTRLLPGPWCSMVLADFGADVLKVEQPEIGDYSRWAPPRYRTESVYFQSVNRNKRSLALDLTKPAGREVLLDLVRRADVVLESFRPGVADRLGIGYRALSDVNPELVYCAVTGFGQTGPYRDFAGHDINIAGMTGLVARGAADGAMPPMPGLQMADFAAASIACIGVLLALWQCRRTGRGQYVDVAMFDSLVSWLPIAATSALARLAGGTGEPRLEAWGGNPRYAIYRTADDKYLSVSLLERKFWEGFCRHVGRPDLIDPNEDVADRITDHGARGRTYAAFMRELFLTKPRDAWVSELQAADIPCCPVYTIEEALADPHLAARGMLGWLEHPAEGRIPQIASPIHLSNGGPRLERTAPSLGEHTDEVLRWLGHGADAIERLRREGVVR